MFKWQFRWVGELDCTKIGLPQDEYDHSEVLDEWLYEWNVNVIFSIFDEPHRQEIYKLTHDRAQFRQCLTGYLDEPVAGVASRANPYSRRRFDVVYRATHLPYWFGSHGQLKHSMADAVAQRSRAHRLSVDISTKAQDTILGKKWLDFLASGKTVIGCESGSSVLDRRGEIRAAIQLILREDPGLSFSEVSHLMPAGWDDHTFFAISPRHLEAVTTRTCQFLIEGDYSGVLKPNRHYIPVKRDLSNFDEVLEICRDGARLQEMADCAYDEIYLSGRYSYRTFSTDVLEFIPGGAGDKRGPVFPSAFAMSAGLSRGSVTPSHPRPHSQVAAARAEKARTERRSGLFRWLTSRPSRALIGVRLIWADWALTRILLAYIRRPSARHEVRPVALLEDLTVLGIIRQAQAGWLTAGEQFRVDLLFDRRSGRLALVSRRPTEPTAPNVESMLSPRMLSRVTSIVFDHSRVGDRIHHLITTRRWFTILIPRGRIELRALAQIARAHPTETFAALNIPSRGVRDRYSALGSARTGVVQNVLALYLAMTDRPLRGILHSWLFERRLRRTVDRRNLMRDLLHLGLIRQALTNRATNVAPFSIDVDCKKGAVQLTSAPARIDGVAKPAKLTAIRSIAWNHSAISDEIFYRVTRRWFVRVQIPWGRYSFDAVTEIARIRPDLVREAMFAVPNQRSLFARVSMYPAHYAQKGFAAFKAGLRDRTLRRLLRDSRSLGLSWDAILEDVLKLWLVRTHRGFAIASSIEDGTLRICSLKPEEPCAKADVDCVLRLLKTADFKGIEWDHSRIGLSVSMKSLGLPMVVHLPNRGVHRFDSLREIAHLDPEGVVNALRPALAVAVPVTRIAEVARPEPASASPEELAVAPATVN